MKSYGMVSMVGVAVLVACGPAAGGPVDGGGSGEGGSDESPAPDVDDLARLATAMCERQAACECVVTDPWLDLAECEGVHHEGLRRLTENAEAADDYAFDAACLRELADCWEQLECGESYDAVCAPDCAVHRLNLGTGDECEPEPHQFGPSGFVQECAEDLACLSGHGYAVCDTPAPLQVGESCQDGALHRSCAPDLYCADVDGESYECQARVGEGGVCDSFPSCEIGLRCDEGGRCRPKIEVGGACEDTADCSADLTCHPTLAVCVERAEVGEQCRFAVGPNDRFVPCIEGAWCGEALCEAQLELGEACMYSDGCPLGSACEGGVCTACASGSCALDPVCSEVPAPYAYPNGD
jgi:hypothetical protein